MGGNIQLGPPLAVIGPMNALKVNHSNALQPGAIAIMEGSRQTLAHGCQGHHNALNFLEAFAMSTREG